MTPSFVAREYASRGYAAIGLSDHYDRVLSREKIRQTRCELEETDADIEVFVGTEACVYLPGWPRRTLKRDVARSLDFCLLSPSHRPSGEEAVRFARLPLEVQAERVMDSFIESVRTDFADVVAHPFAYGPSQLPDRDTVLSLLPDNDLAWALELARKNEIAMEFSPRILGLDEAFLGRFVGLCKQAGVRFSVGGDAHAPTSIGNDGLVLPLLKRFGIEPGLIWYPESHRALHR